MLLAMQRLVTNNPEMVKFPETKHYKGKKKGVRIVNLKV